jgi:hypothetical protein
MTHGSFSLTRNLDPPINIWFRLSTNRLRPNYRQRHSQSSPTLLEQENLRGKNEKPRSWTSKIRKSFLRKYFGYFTISKSTGVYPESSNVTRIYAASIITGYLMFPVPISAEHIILRLGKESWCHYKTTRRPFHAASVHTRILQKRTLDCDSLTRHLSYWRRCLRKNLIGKRYGLLLLMAQWW